MENVISILTRFVADAVWCCAAVAALSLGCAVVWKWQDLAEGLKGEPKTFRAVFVAMLVVAATLFSKVDPNGARPNLNAPLSGTAPMLQIGAPDDSSADVAKFAAINWTTNGVDLVLHRPEDVSVDAVEVTLAGSTNLVTATWEPYTNVVFAAGETNVAVFVDSAQLDAHSVSNMCFFAFINSGDSDGDGLADWDERFNLKTAPYAVDSDGDGLDDALDPEPAVFDPFSRAHWTLWDDATAFSGGSDPGVVFETAVPVRRRSLWRQYFLSGSPDGAAAWALDGYVLEWRPSADEPWTVLAPPAGDSLRLALPAAAEWVSFRLRLSSDGAPPVRPQPLHLLTYRPSVSLGGGTSEAEDDGGRVLSVCTAGDASVVPFSVDRSARPCAAPLAEEESDVAALLADDCARADVFVDAADVCSVLERSADGLLESCAFLPPRAGLYPRPCDESADAASFADGTWTRGILVLDPSVVFGPDACSDAPRAVWDAETDTYSPAVDWPLDTACLRRAWRSSADGSWDERPDPQVDPGVDTNAYDFVDATLELADGGASCTGRVRVFGEEVWSGTAERRRRPCRGEDPADPLADGCGCCSGGCADGDCDALERPVVLNSSLCFRIPLGSPRKGQVSGFLHFAVDDPAAAALGPGLFELSMRPDADWTETASGAARTVECADSRGRKVVLETMADGVRATVRDHATQRLEHTWEVTRPGGSASRIRFRRISRLDNTMDDLTFAYDDGTGSWTREDAVSGARETTVVTGGLGEREALVETKTTTGADGVPLVRTVVERTRLGSRRNAVLRETRRAEYGWDAAEETWHLASERLADYYGDPDAASFGKARLVRGGGEPWVYRAYDGEGREVLRMEQRDGSPVPACFPAPAGYGNGFSMRGTDTVAFVTVTGYAPHPGDAGAEDDSDLPRTVSRYAVAGESWAPVSRAWHVYTHPSANGLPVVKCETWRAAHAGSTFGSDDCARSFTVAYEESAPGVPLVLRGETAEALDEDGVRTVRTSAVAAGTVATTERKYRGENEFPTYAVEARDAARGSLLRRAEYVRAAAVEGGAETDDVLVGEETSLYDEKDRLRSTAYLDGTSETNHYSCCRLLWREDREGRRTLRSAVTGEDRLYYAEEDVWLGEISSDGGHRATQHFFDALGRETNTTTYVETTPGAAVDRTASNGREAAVKETFYPRGTDDLVVRVDERGAVRTSETFRYDDRVVTRETVSTNGVGVVTNTTTAYLGGATVSHTSWAGGWRETRDADEYDMRNRDRYRRRTVSASDSSSYTAERSRLDLLGRTWLAERPGAGGGTYRAGTTYDGGSSRVVTATVSDRPSTAYAYDDCGELARTTRDGVSVSESRTYERDPDDGELYRVARAYRTTVVSSPVLVRETRTRLTGLSKDGLLSRRVQVGEDGRETVEEKRPAPEGFVYSDLFETARWTEGETPSSTLTKFGLVWYESSMDGTRLYDYDALGRVYGIDRSDWMCSDTWLDYSYDESGNIVEVFDSVSQLSSVGHARTRIAYDRLGRETTREDTFGHVVTNAYDALGQPALATGDRHPVSTGHDAAGNRTRLATTRDGGATWDATQWEYAVPGGQATAKVYADSSRVAYTRTQEGWPVRTTWARGAWKEYAYDGHGNVTGASYSSTPSVSCTYDALDCLVSAENSATGDGHFSYACTYDAHRNCTEEAVAVGGQSFTLARTFDEFLRPSSVSVSHGNAEYSTKVRTYDSENRVSGYTLGGDGTPGSGLAVSVSYQGHLPVGMLFRFPNGNEMTLALTREPGRATWITRRDYEFNGSPFYWHRTTYDAEGRPTETEDSLSSTRQWLYNRRSELVGASGTQANPYDYAYSYDSIGNRLTSSDDSGTATYAANCLNQYTQVTRNQTPQNLTYDADGNLTQDDRFTYSYDDENRLVSVTPRNPQVGSLAIENAYDHRSRRIRKVVKSYDGSSWNVTETRLFVWDGWNIVFEQITFSDNTTRTVEYFWGNDLSGSEQGAGGVGGLLVTRIDGVFYIPVYGANGNIMMYIGGNGWIAAQYDYDPYGNILQATGPLDSQFAFGFSTKYHDREVDLVAYQLRTYDPVNGRWLNRDPIEERGGENLYAFCGNNSLLWYDVCGQNWLTCFGQCVEEWRLDWSKVLTALNAIALLNAPVSKAKAERLWIEKGVSKETTELSRAISQGERLARKLPLGHPVRSRLMQGLGKMRRFMRNPALVKAGMAGAALTVFEGFYDIGTMLYCTMHCCGE